MSQIPPRHLGAGTVTKGWLSVGALSLLVVLGTPATIATWAASAQDGQSGATLTLRVQMEGFENTDGEAGVAVWNAAQGFPEEIEHAVATTYVTIQDDTAVARFDQLPPGRYAVTVYHDKNDNRRFDKNWLGMPKEDWGVSNDVRPRLRAPRFDEAVRDLAAGEQLVEIRVD